MRPSTKSLLSISLVVALAACNKQAPEPDQSPATPAPVTAETSGTPLVTPQVTPPAPAKASPSVIASQPGMAGTTWDLTRMQVTGSIMTLQFSVTPAPGKSLFITDKIKVDDVALIDDQTAQRYSVLKDDSGRPMASPVNKEGNLIRVDQGVDVVGVVWFKFPAPPEGTTTVSVTIPEVGPFDGVPVTR